LAVSSVSDMISSSQTDVLCYRKHILADLCPYVCTFQDCHRSQGSSQAAENSSKNQPDPHKRGNTNPLIGKLGSTMGVDKRSYRNGPLFTSPSKLIDPNSQSAPVISSERITAAMNGTQGTKAPTNAISYSTYPSIKAFPSRSLWIGHETSTHDGSTDPPNGGDRLCLFCGARLDVGTYPRHVGRHMEEISFMVLPKPYEEWSFYTDSSGTLDQKSIFSDMAGGDGMLSWISALPELSIQLHPNHNMRLTSLSDLFLETANTDRDAEPDRQPPQTSKTRLHVCTTCARAFTRLNYLKRHERSHTKD